MAECDSWHGDHGEGDYGTSRLYAPEKAIDSVLADDTVGILLITESLAQLCADQLADLKMSGRTPLVVEIPDRHGTRNHDAIGRYIREAIGVKL